MQDRHTLIVMRHAKAGELPGGPDFERALRPRGQRDSAAAGRWLAAGGLYPGVVLCSAARRTRQTWQHLSETLFVDAAVARPDVLVEQDLYYADRDDVAELVMATSDDVSTLLYIGHNPAAAGLVELLADEPTAFPTAAVAVIHVPPMWSEVVAGSGELVASWTPRGGEAAR